MLLLGHIREGTSLSVGCSGTGVDKGTFES